MQMHSLFPSGVLITNGMGANPSALITAAKWNLFGCNATISLRQVDGGSRPYAPGEIQNFYKPVTQLHNSDNNHYIPYNINLHDKNIVKVNIVINGKTNEKEFVLNKKPFKALINVISIINIGNNKISINLNKIKHRLHDISVMMKNIKRK